MADPLSNPLGAVTQAFEGYFSPEYLAFMLIMGYFIFFLFFYNTDKWKTIDWTERFFFGFILGIISAMISLMLFLPIAFPLTALHLDDWTGYLSYLLPILFIVALASLRAQLKLPLSSASFHHKIDNALTQNRAYWPIILLICSSAIILGLQINNPTLDNPSVWTSYLIILNVFVPVYTISILTFTSLLSSFSEPLDQSLSILFKVGNWYFLSFNKTRTGDSKKNRHLSFSDTISELKIAFSDQITKFKRIKINYQFLKILTVLLLVIIVFFATDRMYQIVTPSIQIIDTQSPELGHNNVEFFRCYDGSIIYLSEITQVYWVKLPFFNLRFINISIQNPSNFNGNLDLINSRYQNLQLKVVANDSFAYTLARSNQLDYINILPLNSSLQGKSMVNFTINYYDQIKLDSVRISDPSSTVLANGSTTITVNMEIKNDNNFTLHTSGVPLYRKSEFNNLGNATSYTWAVNHEIQLDRVDWLDIFDNSVFSDDIYVPPHESMSFVSQVTFGVGE
ncbi:MAG: hypothetical protein ACQCN6_08065 [Candidatus Bathyarchaeia archaeon]